MTNLLMLREALASCAIEGNEFAIRMLEVLKKVGSGETLTAEEARALARLLEGQK